MPRLKVSIVLPYLLRLHDGDYQAAAAGGSVRVTQPPLLPHTLARTTLSAEFEHKDGLDVREREDLRRRNAIHLLRRANALLRWIRAVSRDRVVELTQAQASPFKFEVISGDGEGWTEPVSYEADAPDRLDMSREELTTRVRAGLAGGAEPAVADLFLIDADRAANEGRFREAVLFCWSTIDATFGRKYDELVDKALDGDWADGREFFKGLTFGLRHKMSAGMHFVAKRSLFKEPEKFWDKLSNSYTKRNKIIHQGENANEEDARLALEVAYRVVAVMNSV
jgi:hypothetical protein